MVGPAHISKRIVTDWENQSEYSIPLFEINPEESELFSKWAYDSAKDFHGYGSIVWLKKGKILDFEKDAGESGGSGIERKTSKIFLK